MYSVNPESEELPLSEINREVHLFNTLPFLFAENESSNKVAFIANAMKSFLICFLVIC